MSDHEQTTAKANLPITIYSSPTCGFCYMVKDYLTDKGYAFEEKDISVDQDALTFVLEKVGQAVTPIVSIGDTIIVGFDRPKIDDALAHGATA